MTDAYSLISLYEYELRKLHEMLDNTQRDIILVLEYANGDRKTIHVHSTHELFSKLVDEIIQRPVISWRIIRN